MRYVRPNITELGTIIDSEAQWDPIAGGFQFTEGPVWVAEERTLYFTDISADTIYRWSEDGGKVSVFRRSSRKANGMTRDPNGFLLVCEQVTRCIGRIDRNGTGAVIADRYDGRRLNSPNDIVVADDGSIWFTDPVYGILDVAGGYPGKQEQPAQGVYRWDPGSGLKRLVNDMEGPNGLAFSPDGTVLYVTDSERFHIRKFYIDGINIHDADVFAVIERKSGASPPDGLRVTPSGHLFVAGPGGVWIFDGQGHHLGLIENPEVVSNCELGVSDRLYLYVTATSSVCRIPIHRDLLIRRHS